MMKAEKAADESVKCNDRPVMMIECLEMSPARKSTRKQLFEIVMHQGATVV